MENFYGNYIIVISRTGHVENLINKTISSDYMTNTPENFRNRILWLCQDINYPDCVKLTDSDILDFDFRQLNRELFLVDPSAPEPESKIAILHTDIFNIHLYIQLAEIASKISDIVLFSNSEEEDYLIPLIVGIIKSPNCLPDIHVTAECSSSSSIKILYESGVNAIFNAEKLLQRLTLSSLVNSTFKEFLKVVIFRDTQFPSEHPIKNIRNSIYSIIKVSDSARKSIKINENNFGDFQKLCHEYSIIPISAYTCTAGYFTLIPVTKNSNVILCDGDSLIVIAKNYTSLRGFESSFKNRKQLIYS